MEVYIIKYTEELSGWGTKFPYSDSEIFFNKNDFNKRFMELKSNYLLKIETYSGKLSKIDS